MIDCVLRAMCDISIAHELLLGYIGLPPQSVRYLHTGITDDRQIFHMHVIILSSSVKSDNKLTSSDHPRLSSAHTRLVLLRVIGMVHHNFEHGNATMRLTTKNS